MTIEELLKNVGVADDVIEKVTSGMKENKIYTSGEENIDIRYGKLKDQHTTVSSQLAEANKLIEDLKKNNKDNEDLQNKVTGYEGKIAELENQLTQTKLESAIKIALLSEKAIDVDYLTFKLKEKGDLELNETEQIKGWKDKIDALKTQFPTQFESSAQKRIEEKMLPEGNESGTLTKEDILKKPYSERIKIYNEDPEGYNKVMKG